MNFKSLGLLLLIIAIGAFFRFFGLNWDQGFHLHPDERFLTMVGIASKLPNNFFIYLNPTLSPFNPTNNNFSFFVYGIFPITLVKFLAVFFKMDTYDSFTMLGRFISALFDTMTMILVFFTAKILVDKAKLNQKIPLIAALFYAIAVFPIQSAHFFTTDVFLNFFTFLSIYFILKYENSKKIAWLLLSAIAFGIALACKVSALAALPLLVGLITLGVYKRGVVKTLTIVGIFLLSFYIILRLSDPYIFQSPNPFDIHLNTQFITSISTLNSYNNPQAWYPPGVQWIHKTPILFSLINIFLFGVGPLYFLFTCIGIFLVLKTKKNPFIAVITWIIVFFIYQSTQYVKTMRYFLFLYPFFAIFAAVGYVYISKKINKYFLFLIILFILAWPLMFLNIYAKPHTRVDASYWIEQHIPGHSIILTEYWDDPLPLPVFGVAEKNYTIEEMHVFDKDTPEKWRMMNTMLKDGNYIILSSNRGWGSIPTVPEDYPKMTKFYQDLLSNKLHYKKIAEFTSYPSLLYIGIPLTIPDDIAEEAFTVFDHPKVLIFKKE